jgi:predicted membrane protein
MSYSEGGFVLRQILASSIVLGPLLLLIGIFFYLYKQDRKTVVFYLVAGFALTLVGAACLYTEFKEEDRRPQIEEQASK